MCPLHKNKIIVFFTPTNRQNKKKILQFALFLFLLLQTTNYTEYIFAGWHIHTKTYTTNQH